MLFLSFWTDEKKDLKEAHNEIVDSTEQELWNNSIIKIQLIKTNYSNGNIFVGEFNCRFFFGIEYIIFEEKIWCNYRWKIVIIKLVHFGMIQVPHEFSESQKNWI